MLCQRRMTLDLISETSGRIYKLSARAFGRVLHLARREGWQPERVTGDWPSDSWETAIILPHLGRYMPGRFSRADAQDLRIALTRALATGSVAAEGTIQFAALTVLDAARSGPFRVRCANSDFDEPAVGTRQTADLAF